MKLTEDGYIKATVKVDLFFTTESFEEHSMKTKKEMAELFAGCVNGEMFDAIELSYRGEQL